MSKKSYRNHNLRLIKLNYSYSIDEIAELLGVHKQTVYEWKKRGLKTIDDTYPALVHGGDLIEFLSKEKSNRKVKCKDNEMYCFKCRAAREVSGNKIDIIHRNSQILDMTGRCAICDTKMCRSSSLKNLSLLQTIFEIQPMRSEILVGSDNCTVNTETKE